MRTEEVRDALRALLGDPQAREEIRKSLGIADIDPAELLDRIDRNTETLRQHGEAIREQGEAIREQGEAIRTLQQQMVALQEQVRALQQQMVALQEQVTAGFARVDRRMDSFGRRLDGLGARWGLMSEESFREGMRDVLSTLLPGCTVRRWRAHDQAGKVLGTPSWIEIDIAVENGHIVLVEVKSSASRADVAQLARVAALYQEVEARRPDRILLVSPHVDPSAKALAEMIGIEVSTSTLAG